MRNLGTGVQCIMAGRESLNGVVLFNIGLLNKDLKRRLTQIRDDLS